MDRRTKYTIDVISDAFLHQVAERGFAQTTIADICRKAGVHRSTFYLHFTRKEDVLDLLLEEAFSQIENTMEHLCPGTGRECKIPLCIFIREKVRYQPIFTDPSLGGYVIGKLARTFKDEFVLEICRNSYYSKEDAETIFWFQIHGCYSLAVHNIHLPADVWEKKKAALDLFIRNGSKR